MSYVSLRNSSTTQLDKMSPVTIYTTALCPYCDMAKQLLERKGVSFSEIDVTGKPVVRDEILLRIRGLDRLLNTPEPKPLKFDAQGLASVSGWRVHNVFGLGELSQEKEAENRPTLKIRAAADPRAGGSWRARVLLEPGQYRFEGELRTQGVVPTTDRRGTGAGLRISRLPRPAQLSGDSPWTKVFFDFSVDAESQGTELVCELRATQGEAWFDLNSLKLVREGK